MKERKTESTKEGRNGQKRKGKVEEDLGALTKGRVRKEKERPWTQRGRDLKEKFKVESNSWKETWQLLRM